MQTSTATTTTTARTTAIHHSIRRRMSELARRSQLLHLDPRSVQQIRLALYS